MVAVPGSPITPNPADDAKAGSADLEAGQEGPAPGLMRKTTLELGVSHHRVVLDRGEAGCCDIITDTISMNKCLFFTSFSFWPLFAALLYALDQSPYPSWKKGMVVGTCVAAGLYFFFMVCLAGLFPCCACDDCKGGPCIGDYIHDFVEEEEVDPEGLRPILLDMRNAQPNLTLHVRCYHTESSGSGKNRSSKTVVTFRGSVSLKLNNVYDISVTPDAFVESVNYCSATYCSVSYHKAYSLNEENRKILAEFRERYYNNNKHRDASCEVTEDYSISARNDKHISSVTKDNKQGLRYRCAQYCVNWGCLWLAMYTALYIFYLCLWKCLVRPFRYHNVKTFLLDKHQVIP